VSCFEWSFLSATRKRVCCGRQIQTLGPLERVTCDGGTILSRTGRSHGRREGSRPPCLLEEPPMSTVSLLVGGMSQHDLPTGDVEGDTRNPRRGRRCEEERGGSDVLGLAYSPEGKGFAQGLPLGFGHP
jgi:hypothetical protein